MKKKFKPSITQFGDDAFLVKAEAKGLQDKLNEYILALTKYLRRFEGTWIDIISAEESFAVRFNPLEISVASAYKQLDKKIDAFNFQKSNQNYPIVNIPVCYSDEFAPDLHIVAQEKSLSIDDVVEQHTSVTYQVTAIGFTPGFAYLGDLPEALFMPRRSVPRLYLQPGSIGITGYRTGVYPLGGPGGWQIIGCSPMALFDPSSENPFKLITGMRVKFTAISPEQFHQYQTQRRQ